jgi:hypothetical protein
MIRCDNGPEYLSAAITEWALQAEIVLHYIQPGNPQQNAYVERFNRTVRYEWLSQYHWDDLDHVQRFATAWMWTYNHERPNMALGGITPETAAGHGCLTFLLLPNAKNGGITMRSLRSEKRDQYVSTSSGLDPALPYPL